MDEKTSVVLADAGTGIVYLPVASVVGHFHLPTM
jgi:hypothetical protein